MEACCRLSSHCGVGFRCIPCGGPPLGAAVLRLEPAIDFLVVCEHPTAKGLGSPSFPTSNRLFASIDHGWPTPNPARQKVQVSGLTKVHAR